MPSVFLLPNLVRPLQFTDNIWVQTVSDHCLHTTNHHNIDENLEYEFARVFGPNSSQAEVYSHCVELCVCVCVCVSSIKLLFFIQSVWFISDYIHKHASTHH